jgi:uridine phosphorylase
MPPAPTTALKKPTEAVAKPSLDSKQPAQASWLENQHLSSYADNDTMYHFDLNTRRNDLKALFGNVKVVITGGSQSRIKSLGKLLHEKYEEPGEPVDYAKGAGRFSLFCTRHVLMFNHGMGSGSASIAFHEILKLLDYSGVQREKLSVIRIGTCGGIGVSPGTICLSENVLTETLDDHFPFVECGKVKPLPMNLDDCLRQKLAAIADRLDIESLQCKTLGTNDFYLGQGRLDGAFCTYDEEERYEFLQTLFKSGVRNIEMESHTFAAFCTRAGVNGAVMCIALLNRLGRSKDNDQVTAGSATMAEWMDRGIRILLEFIESEE